MAFVQQQIENNVGPSDSRNRTLTVTAGNFLVALGAVYNNSNPNSVTVTDNNSNTWNKITTVNGDDWYAFLSYVENANAGSTTITATGTQAGSYWEWGVAEFSGVLTSSALDKSGVNSAFNTATDASVTTGEDNSQADVLVVAAACVGSKTDADVQLSTPAGYEIISHSSEDNGPPHDLIYKIISSVETSAIQWSHDPTTGVSDGWSTVIASFKLTGGGAGPSPSPIFQNYYANLLAGG